MWPGQQRRRRPGGRKAPAAGRQDAAGHLARRCAAPARRRKPCAASGTAAGHRSFARATRRPGGPGDRRPARPGHIESAARRHCVRPGAHLAAASPGAGGGSAVGTGCRDGPTPRRQRGSRRAHAVAADVEAGPFHRGGPRPLRAGLAGQPGLRARPGLGQRPPVQRRRTARAAAATVCRAQGHLRRCGRGRWRTGNDRRRIAGRPGGAGGGRRQGVCQPARCRRPAIRRHAAGTDVPAERVARGLGCAGTQHRGLRLRRRRRGARSAAGAAGALPAPGAGCRRAERDRRRPGLAAPARSPRPARPSHRADAPPAGSGAVAGV